MLLHAQSTERTTHKAAALLPMVRQAQSSTATRQAAVIEQLFDPQAWSVDQMTLEDFASLCFSDFSDLMWSECRRAARPSLTSSAARRAKRRC